jgi:hypothetical protein
MEKGINFIDLRTQDVVEVIEGQFKNGMIDGYAR